MSESARSEEWVARTDRLLEQLARETADQKRMTALVLVKATESALSVDPHPAPWPDDAFKRSH